MDSLLSFFFDFDWCGIILSFFLRVSDNKAGDDDDAVAN